MPTGIAIQNAQLFDAAERVLLREGPHALSSRAVTSEAGCAKGVIHRHFSDFDAFLAALIEDRIADIAQQSAHLRAKAGTDTIANNLTRAMTELFQSVAVAMVGLLISRDTLRARIRETRPTGMPVLGEAVDMTGSYLVAEREVGRLTADIDIETLAPALIGALHMLFADRTAPSPAPETVHKTVSTLITTALLPAE